MELFNGAGAQPCQLLDNKILQAQTWLMLAHIRARERLRFLASW